MKLTDGVAHILIITAKAINPTDHEHVTGPELVEQAATLGARDEAGVDTRHAVVRHDRINGKPCCPGMIELLFDGVSCRRYSRVKDGRQAMPSVR
jgi:hypothetical protein